MDEYLSKKFHLWIFNQYFFFYEYGQIFMDEKLNFDGMKFIHVTTISRRTPFG